MVGLNDNKGLTDENILKEASARIGLYPKDAKIRFLMFESFRAPRFSLHDDAIKYKTSLGDQLLASSVIVGSGCDPSMEPEEIEEGI